LRSTKVEEHSRLPVKFHNLSELNYGAPGLNLSACGTWLQLCNNLSCD